MSLEPGRLLPLFTAHSGGRSPITCEYRCGNACAHEAPNPTGNEYFGDIAKGVSRRGVFKAGAVMAAAAGGFAALSGTAAAATPAQAPAPLAKGRAVPGTDFTPVPPNKLDAVSIPDGYAQHVVIRWGDPVVPGAPKFDFRKQTAAAQAKQFGYNNDFVGLIPQDPLGLRNLLVVNHEYTTEVHLFPADQYDPANPTEEQVKIAWAAHGLSVLQTLRDPIGGALRTVPSPLNRRITLDTIFEVRGPAAGSKYLKTSADPSGKRVRGTQNNCSGGVTPWGTVLSGEENFHQYFAHADKVSDPTEAARLKRYAVGTGESTRKWERFDQRWDVSREPNEPNRFGWVVEIDPNDPHSTPVKHTALGRFKHEAANVKITADGRVAVYSGDDERFEYIYKFVSKGKYKKGHSALARRHNSALLDDGTLYVAKFSGNSPGEIDGTGKLPADGEFDGTGEWIPLASGDKSFVDGFTAEEVYVFTRQAADRAGATKMDRPEDIEPNPVNGRIYAALTNNSDRGAAGKAAPDEANPRTRNKNGHILEWDEDRGDSAATRFSWRLLLVCGDPATADTYFGGFPKDQVSPISCPDNVAFDPHGNLWISTDGNTLGANDGLFSVPVTGPERGHVKQFLSVPVGAETCGPVVTENLVLVAVQHPGEDAPSSANPTSHWPDGGSSQPRPAIVSVWKKGAFGLPGRIGRR
ncbi:MULTISPECIES: PhoX family protein [Amycolatopsis]|uniref:PhoX family protein n=1 Tax=Amycolatopsis dendrobii TaxID=2760662 RepID=A0A7W3W0E0_9PSEU|nr:MULTISPECIES: PhoX family phosphatase [Amycolatopsis]MBB1156002.1 PhoX family protein [Amycolatopsis dendrobii]UKD53197.1 PhoX family phosphatase [Amycolatopsis sp. FU40]